MSDYLGIIIFMAIFMVINCLVLHFGGRFITSYENSLKTDKNIVPEQIFMDLESYIEVFFQFSLVDKLIVMRKREEQMSEEVLDDIIIEHSQRILDSLPVRLKDDFKHGFNKDSKLDVDLFIIEIIIHSLRSKIGGIKG